MGQAQQKAKALASWTAALSDDDRIIVDVAQRVYRTIVVPLEVTGMCYRLAFFLTEFLRERHAIEVIPVVAFVNDGEDDVMASHAWIEFNGKKTDLSLTRTKHAGRQLTGSLLILDRDFSKGEATYSYHLERDAAALAVIATLQADPQYGPFVQAKENEHAAMLAIARSPGLMRGYLDSAPDGLGYEALARLADGALKQTIA
jgi:hypothetical protein